MQYCYRNILIKLTLRFSSQDVNTKIGNRPRNRSMTSECSRMSWKLSAQPPIQLSPYHFLPLREFDGVTRTKKAVSRKCKIDFYELFPEFVKHRPSYPSTVDKVKVYFSLITQEPVWVVYAKQIPQQRNNPLEVQT